MSVASHARRGGWDERSAHTEHLCSSLTCCEVWRVSERRQQIGPACVQPGSQGSQASIARQHGNARHNSTGRNSFHTGRQTAGWSNLASQLPHLAFSCIFSNQFNTCNKNILCDVLLFNTACKFYTDMWKITGQTFFDWYLFLNVKAVSWFSQFWSQVRKLTKLAVLFVLKREWLFFFTW